MSIDARFHAQAMQRKADQAKQAERQATYKRHLAAVRAEYAKPQTTIDIDGVIGSLPGEVSARQIKSQLPTDGSPITVKIHSEGGSVFEAFSIFDAIASYPGRKTAVVESMAFSAASLLLAAFDEVEITENGYVMIHAPHFEGEEDLDESQKRLLAQLRERMVGIYAAKTGKPRSFIERELEREVFYDAEASIDLGLVNRIAKRPASVTARIPARVMAKIKTAKQSPAAQWKAAVDALASRMTKAQAIVEVDKTHPGLRQRMLAEVNRR
jgi:ATP-dependent protease ClpP protease subunit